MPEPATISIRRAALEGRLSVSLAQAGVVERCVGQCRTIRLTRRRGVDRRRVTPHDTMLSCPKQALR